MSKKGVAKISGPSNPQIGAPATYSVTEWYPETPSSQRNGSNITWELFRKRSNGNYTSTNIKKKGITGTFTFEEKALGQKFFVEGYLNSPEKKGNTIIHIEPVKGTPKILSLTLFNSNKKKITEKPKYGQTLVAEIKTQNMFKEKLLMQIWERDTAADTGHSKDENTLIYEKQISVNANGINDEKIILTELMMKKAQGTGFSSIMEGGEHEYYLVVKQNTFSTYSPQTVQVLNQKITVKGNGSNPPAENPDTATNVDQNVNQQNSTGKCPRCGVLTEDELKAVFPSVTNTTLIKEIVKSFNEFCKKFNVNTCTLKAHFFAQAKQESGDSLTPAINGESMNYNIAALKTTGFLNVSTSYMFGNKTGIKMAEDLGRKANEGALDLDRQIKIANFVYGLDPKAKTLGNKAPSDNQSLSENDNEGWRYRGRGMLQITGKNNYTDIEAHVNKVLGNQTLNIKDGRQYDGKFTATEALLSGLGDWDLHKMYIPAKVGVTKEACLNVIKIINSKTKSKTKRVAHLIGGAWYKEDDTTTTTHTIKEKDSMKSIFRVKECKLLNPVDDQVASDDDGVLNKMKKIADQHHTYKQETNNLRTDDSEEGISKMDCSEFVSRYLHELGITSSIKYMTTDNMISEKAFRKVIGNNNIDFVAGSDGKDFTPQRGDIFVWRRSDAGHTGIVYSYDSTNDVVVILEAIGNVGAVSEKDQVKNGGYAGTGCSRTAKYTRLKGALWGHGGWVGYFRPKNYTKKL
ncbi:CHAP domain-containing protein [Chryseobacterium sp. S-02]|uniref:CHAP domain-containing protein n=1 Tax=Chryseobacterium sp. S-02 TaxID=3404064 RepID=UPI003CF936EA